MRTGVQWDEHRVEALIENLLFLLESGVSFDVACVRLDVKRDSVVRLFQRKNLPQPWLQEASMTVNNQAQGGPA